MAKKQTKRKASRIIGFTLVTLFTIGIVFSGGIYAGALLYYNNVEQQKPINKIQIVKQSLLQDPTLLAKSQQLGIDVSRLNLNLAPSTEAGALADFEAPNTIDINPGQDEKATLLSIGHEYYHYYWENETTPNEKITLGNQLVDFYNTDAWLQNRMRPYTDTGCKDDCLTNELHSVMCTELPSYVITQEFTNYCNSVIPNRSLFIQ